MTTEERFERIETNLEKNTAAIRDLIVVSRTLLTTVGELQQGQKHTDERLNNLIDTVDELRQAQKHTDEKLNVLIETVDRFVRSWQKANGNQ